MSIYFSDHFDVTKRVLDKHGAFDISLVADLPLFIDPFLLFNSKKPKYRKLHDEIIAYLTFLRDKADVGTIDDGLLGAWYFFREVKQTWLGFAQTGNRGSGLGRDFARALHGSLNNIFSDFGEEKITKGSHLEKVCLIKEGVGRDKISDFTTNLIKGFLCEYTQDFARRYLRPEQRRRVPVLKAHFNYETETWEPVEYELPWTGSDYVLLTPREILTKDDTWINKDDLLDDFDRLPEAIPNDQLRSQIDNYFRKMLPRRRRGKEPTEKERRHAAAETLRQFPALIDAYIRFKEENGDKAKSISDAKVSFSEAIFVDQLKELRHLLESSEFYETPLDTYEDAHRRVAFLKDVIEQKGGHRIFYFKGKPIEREEDLQTMYRLCWFGTRADVSREVNDGRGPADYKISRGSGDKTIVEFKLAKNSSLKRNLHKQAAVYQKASDAKRAIKVVLYFTAAEHRRVIRTLKELKIEGHRDVVLIDARKDNKPSGSKA